MRLAETLASSLREERVMVKSLGFSFAGLCALAAVLDVAARAFGTLTFTHVSVGSGVFLAVVAMAPLFMRPSDADLNDVGIVREDDEETTESAALRLTLPRREP